jgi:hypothetical protein
MDRGQTPDGESMLGDLTYCLPTRTLAVRESKVHGEPIQADSKTMEKG